MILYHFTPLRNLSKVLQQGLVPRIGARSKRLGERHPAIYFFPTIQDAEEGLINWLQEEFGENTRLAFLAVTIPEGVQVHSDVDHERHVFDPIPPQNITVVSRDATGESGLNHLVEGLVEGPVIDGRIVPRLTNGQPPHELFRIMSLAEYKAGLQRGAFESRDGRIHAADRPLLHYCEPGEDNVLVAIRYDDADGWKAKHSGEGVVAITSDPLPSDRVRLIARGSRHQLETAAG